MSITFQCPNGHKLSGPESQAGKPGKCPKCGAVFRVPQPQAAAPAAADGSPNPFSFLSQEADEEEQEQGSTEEADEGTEPAEEDDAPAPEPEDQLQIAEGPAGADEILFLCPNGHRLHGPASLVGRPGQCPHCQVRFLIPSPEDVPDDDEAEQDHSALSLDEILINIDTGGRGSSPGGTSGSRLAVPPPPPLSCHPLATLMARLWAGKAAHSSIELHLGDGKLLVPDEFAERSPVANYGLFAVRDANGSHTLTAVSWESIERITVRGLAQLPKEWFDAKG